MDIEYTIRPCWLGSILVARNETGICAITLGDDAVFLADDLKQRFPTANLQNNDAGLEPYAAHIIEYSQNPHTPLQLPLDMQGTPFQQSVWKALCQVPAGQTATYSEIARQIGAPTSARAVAQACGANRLAIIIPCHRIVGADGSLSGYRWGLARKKALLEKEGARPPS